MSTRAIQTERPSIQRLEHKNFGSGIPYYDDELKMPQSIEHEIAINYLSYCFKYIAKDLKLSSISDHPVWYLIQKPIKDKNQKVIYPDLCVSKNSDISRVTSEDLLFSLEVVSMERKRKEFKDTVLMKALNEYNRVPEFVLVYPKASDNRVIEYYSFDGYQYIPVATRNGKYSSKMIKGLSLQEISMDDWRDGVKLEVLYKGKVLVKYEEVWELKEKAEKEKEKAENRAEKVENQLELSIKKVIQRGKSTFEEIAEDFGVSLDYIKKVASL
ncbi:MAG: hypothetical protein KDK90_11815 [Leptospiraceae bacterium]|nr:hypothetical protein [Leptospiraceae bacterium]